MAIGRDHAASIALEYLLQADKRNPAAVGERSAKASVRIGHVFSLDEIPFRAPLIYGFDADALRECWIAHVDRGFRAIASSEIILVSKETDKVLYHGPAGDEG
ncbi:hypothetical protein HRbin33_02183 [bacterium HR33]|nr:hypothetical protein HRbin33_02183 [bacterium HR33]